MNVEAMDHVEAMDQLLDDVDPRSLMPEKWRKDVDHFGRFDH